MGRSLRSPATIKRNRVVIHRGHATPGSATSSRPLLRRIAYAGTNARLHKAEEGWTLRNHAPVPADGKAVAAWHDEPARTPGTDRVQSWRAGAACRRRRRRSSAARVPVVVTLAIFALAFLLPAWPWLSGAVTIPWDAKSQFFPQVQFLASSLARGEWPWWSPNVFAGWARDLRSAVAAVLAAACAACRVQLGGQPARIRCGDLRLSVPRRCRHHPVLSRPRLARRRGAGRRDGICARWFRQCAHAAHRPDHQPGLSAARALARAPARSSDRPGGRVWRPARSPG